MIQFNKTEVCQLLRACAKYKAETSSEWIWDEYNDLEKKLTQYGEEVSEEAFSCRNYLHH